MPLTHQDLELMMQGIAAPGNAALAVREERRRNRSLDIEEAMRQKMLEQEVRQTAAAEGRNQLLQQKSDQQADQDTLKDMITVNPFLTDESRASANTYLKTHPKWGQVGIQLAPPEKKPVPQPGQSAGVAELQKAREFRDKAAALGPEGDLDLQQWYIKAADVLEQRAAKPQKDPNALTRTDVEKASGTPGMPPDRETRLSGPATSPAWTNQPTSRATAPGGPAPPAVGEVRKGYRFKGGDPSKPANWEKVQ